MDSAYHSTKQLGHRLPVVARLPSPAQHTLPFRVWMEVRRDRVVDISDYVSLVTRSVRRLSTSTYCCVCDISLLGQARAVDVVPDDSNALAVTRSVSRV